MMQMKSLLVYGAFGGGVMFLLFILSYLVGIDPLSSIRWIGYLVCFATCWYSVRFYKRFEHTMSAFGFLIGLKASVVFNGAAVTVYALPLVILTQLTGLPKIVEWGRHRVEEQIDLQRESITLSTVEIQTTLDQITVYGLLSQDIVIQLLLGAIFSIIAGVYFRD